MRKSSKYVPHPPPLNNFRNTSCVYITQTLCKYGFVNKLISDLEKAREDLISVIDKVPANKHTTKFLGAWSLKDIVAHLIGWSEHQINTLRFFSMGKVPSRPGNSKNFNDEIIKAKENRPWEQIYSEFIKSSSKLIEEYKNLPQHLWNKQIWLGKQMTPEEYIKLEINHYSKEHLPQIKKLLKK